MQFALINIKTGETISASKMQKMSIFEREKIKPLLFCPGCKRKVTFVKESKDGKIACFRGTHAKGCHLGKSNPSAENDKNRKEVPQKTANYEEYKLKLQNFFKTEVDSPLEDLIENVNRYGKSKRKFTGKIDVHKLTKTKSLPMILREALNNDLEDDNYILNVDHEKISIYDVLYSFDDVTPDMINEWGIFYGYIRSSDGSSWLNSSDKWSSSQFSIKLDGDLKTIFWNVIPNEWNNAVPTIVCGKLKVSYSNRKPYVIVDSPDSLYLQIRRKKVKSKAGF
ncbi:hypothetical protein ACFVWC_16415 [Bacillus mycoides]|uniref:hypothetical protein n=1 Tax=Bacillus mycoides TaxID=1405 RepID=UPI0036E88075